MRQVYSPTNSAEAHMLAHQLELAGIKAHIHGEALQGGVGELPAGGLLQLLVADEDHDEARRLLKSWEETAVTDASPPATKFPTFLVAIFFVVGVTGGWLGKTLLDLSQVTFMDGRERLDTNDDSRDDVTYFYHPGSNYAHRMEADGNFDGRIDVIENYDALGVITDRTQDQDFDGFMETRVSFRRGATRQVLIDSNRNEVADVTQTFEDGVLKREQILDERAGETVRINHFEAGRLARSESDLDHDGVLETIRNYDRFGEVASTETRER